MSPRPGAGVALLALILMLLAAFAYGAACGLTENCDMSIYFDRS